MSVPIDNDQRLAALDPLRSVCVTAPAGSGKTELLSQRVLKLLAGADQPEEILAITFTRKAAAEMHQRIIQALRFAEHAPEPEQSHRRLSWQLAKAALAQDQLQGWQLLSNPNRLKIQTIDSLCASLTRQMPILSNFGAQPSIADNSQQCYQLAVHNFLAQLEQDNSVAADIVVLLSHVDNDMMKVERLLMTLLQRRDQWLPHIGLAGDADAARSKLEQTLQRVIVDVLGQLRVALQPMAPELLPLMDYAAGNIRWQHSESVIGKLAGIVELPAVDIAAIESWLAVVELLLTKTNSWRKTVNKSSGFPTETQEGDKALAKELKAKFITVLASFQDDETLLNLLVQLRHLPAAEYEESQWCLLESLTRLLPGLVAQLTLVFQQRGEVDYSQIAMAALQALGDGLSPSELAMKLDYQLRHILVDEFQDTASTQYRLLERLLEGWAEHNSNNPLRPNTVFIVGDGMQSIYGFREANVGLFLEARKQGINGLQLDDLPLSVNFRSDPAVVNWCNQHFKQAFPRQENLSRGAVPFETAEAFNRAEPDSDIAVYGFSGDDARKCEAEKTVAIIQQLQQKNASTSIAVLVRSRSHLREIIPALSRAGLQWQATDIDPLASYSPIIDLLSLTKALFNIADRVSWVALLRAPWLGLNNQDLHYLLAHQPTQPIFLAMADEQIIVHLSQHGRRRLAEVAAILQAAFKQRQRCTARGWIEGVWLALGGASLVSGRSEFDFIDDYFDLLESYQQGESLSSLSAFEDAVHSLYAAAPVADGCHLQLMTIHKAKGLEFDAVILPAMARPPRSDDKSLLMWREYLPVDGGDTGLVLSPLAASGGAKNTIYDYLRFEQAQASGLENTRLFYVAATRAIKQLYILLSTDLDSKTGQPKDPSKNSLINSAWPALKDSVQWSSVVSGEVEQFGLNFDAGRPVQSLSRIQAQWRAPSWRFANPLEDYYLKVDFSDADDMPEILQNPLPRCVGVVCHWIFEQLIEEGQDFWLALQDSARQAWLNSLLHYHDLPRPLWATAVTAIERAVNNTLNDQKGRWILSGQHEESASELSLLSCFGDKVNQKIIDRCFRDDKGTLWIVDYKTSTPRPGESKDDFIEREMASYRSQLLTYKFHLSVKKNMTSNIKTALYFTHYPHWQECEL